jgi:hypothetical protein
MREPKETQGARTGAARRQSRLGSPIPKEARHLTLYFRRLVDKQCQFFTYSVRGWSGFARGGRAVLNRSTGPQSLNGPGGAARASDRCLVTKHYLGVPPGEIANWTRRFATKVRAASVQAAGRMLYSGPRPKGRGFTPDFGNPAVCRIAPIHRLERPLCLVRYRLAAGWCLVTKHPPSHVGARYGLHICMGYGK